jgi:hypothetical protein
MGRKSVLGDLAKKTLAAACFLSCTGAIRAQQSPSYSLGESQLTCP